MVWFWLLGLSASVLAGREAGLPQQLPGPGATANQNVKNIPARYIPYWMVCKSSKLINIPLTSQRTDHLHGHKENVT